MNEFHWQCVNESDIIRYIMYSLGSEEIMVMLSPQEKLEISIEVACNGHSAVVLCEANTLQH